MTTGNKQPETADGLTGCSVYDCFTPPTSEGFDFEGLTIK